MSANPGTDKKCRLCLGQGERPVYSNKPGELTEFDPDPEDRREANRRGTVCRTESRIVTTFYRECGLCGGTGLNDLVD